jgi:hypothetical protein
MANPAIHALAFASGVALHALWFNGREHHFYGWGYIFTTLLTFISGMLVLSRGYGFPFGQAVTSSFSLVSTVLGGIYSSLAVYRLFLNPLNRFPGPYWTRLGNIAWSAQLGKADGYQKLKALHDKHGDIVRIGSHDLSIVDPEGMQITYGIGAKASKSPWYEGDSPRPTPSSLGPCILGQGSPGIRVDTRSLQRQGHDASPRIQEWARQRYKMVQPLQL